METFNVNTFPSYPAIIDSILFGLTFYGMFYTFLLRTWLLYYDENFESAKKDIVWKKHLYLNYVSNNEISDGTNQQFFLENKQTYGNTEWLLTRLSIPYFISVILLALTFFILNITLSQKDDEALFWLTYYGVNTLIASIPIIGTFIIWSKMSPVNDFFRIRAELRKTMKLWAMLFPVLLVSNFAIANATFQRAMILWSVTTIITMGALLSTKWVLKLAKNKHFEYSEKFVQMEMKKLERTGNSRKEKFITRVRSIVKSAGGDLDSIKSLQQARSNTQNDSVTMNESNVDITTTNTENVSTPPPPKSQRCRTELKEKESIPSTTITSTVRLPPIHSSQSTATATATAVFGNNDSESKTGTADLNKADSNESNSGGGGGGSSHIQMVASKVNQQNQELDVTTIGNAEDIYARYPLREVLKSDMGFRLFMQQLSMYYTFCLFV